MNTAQLHREGIPPHLVALAEYVASPIARKQSASMARRFAQKLNTDAVELAADALHTVFEKGARGGYRDTSKPPAHFVNRALLNHFIDQTRLRNPSHSAISLDATLAFGCPACIPLCEPDTRTPASQLEAAELLNAIRSVLGELDTISQSILTARMEGDGAHGCLAAIGRAFGITGEAVRQRQGTVRRRVTEALRLAGYDYPCLSRADFNA